MTPPGRAQTLALTSWAGLVLAIWAALHWPLTSADAVWPAGVGAALGQAFAHLPPVVHVPWVGVAVMALCGAGGRLMSLLGADPCGPVETLGYSAALGLGLAATAFCLLGLAGRFDRGALSMAAALIAAAGWIGLPPGARAVLGALRGLARSARALTGRAPPPPTCAPAADAPTTPDPGAATPWATAALALAGASLAISLMKACAPPWYPDALFYHLALPRLYLDAGAFVAVPQEPINAAHPGLVQMLFALPMAWGHDELAGVVAWAFFALTVAAAGLLAYATGGRAAGALAVGAVATLPHLAFVGGAPLADSALTAYVALALHATARALAADDAGWARVASLCAGLALTAKYQALAPLGLIALALAGGFWRARGLAGMVKVALPAALLAALPFAPWAVRNQSLYGHPLSPLVASAGTPPPVQALLATYRADWLTHGHRASLARLPLDVTFNADPNDLARYEGELGPLPLMLAPLCLAALFLTGPRRATAWALFAFVAIQGLLWTFGARELRYLFPLAPAYVALALMPLDGELTRALAPLVVAASLAGTLWLTGYARPGDDLLWLAGAEPRAGYYSTLPATGPLWKACEALNREPRPVRVMFFWDDRGYFCRVPYLADHLLPTSSNQILYDLPTGPAALGARLRALGVTHLLINRQAWHEASGNHWTFSTPLTDFLDGGLAKPLPLLGPSDGAGIEVWRLQEPVLPPSR